MGLFDFIKRKFRLRRERKSLDCRQQIEPRQSSPDNTQINDDRNNWTGKNFEFLITGDFDVFADFDNIMTPNTFEWTKIFKNDWDFYQVGQDEFSYSIEPPGIQMTFNKEILFDKAKKIGDEVIENIIATGQNAELLILDSRNVYSFE